MQKGKEMTIQEAKTKICPFMSNAVVRSKDWFTNKSSLSASPCLADKCIAWEFNDQCASGSTTVKSTSDGYCKRLQCGS